MLVIQRDFRSVCCRSVGEMPVRNYLGTGSLHGCVKQEPKNEKLYIKEMTLNFNMQISLALYWL